MNGRQTSEIQMSSHDFPNTLCLQKNHVEFANLANEMLNTICCQPEKKSHIRNLWQHTENPLIEFLVQNENKNSIKINEEQVNNFILSASFE